MSKKLTTDEFIIKSNLIHKNKYFYVKTNYIHSHDIVIITCPTHGDFEQVATDHLHAKCGCPKCDITLALGTDTFIERSKIKHKNKYTYDLVKYGNNNYDKVVITCLKHGNFEQTPFAHLRGQGCPKCANNIKMNKELFIERAIDIHGDRFDYSNVVYKSNKQKVDIVCPVHGIFSQRVSLHLDGFGCKQCKSSRGEKAIAKVLNKLGLKYEVEKRFPNCRNVNTLPFDFWLPDYNICIEFDGIQHHQSIDYFGGDDRLAYTQLNDSIKSKYCNDNNIQLIRISDVNKLSDYFQ